MNTTSSYDWCNNRINKAMAERYPHNFSLCDLDGVSRCHYSSGSQSYTRFIIFESKYLHEPLSDSQLKTLRTLSEGFNWSRFDQLSGVYVIKYDQEDWIKVYRVSDSDTLIYKSMRSMDEVYQLLRPEDQ